MNRHAIQTGLPRSDLVQNCRQQTCFISRLKYRTIKQSKILQPACYLALQLLPRKLSGTLRIFIRQQVVACISQHIGAMTTKNPPLTPNGGKAQGWYIYLFSNLILLPLLASGSVCDALRFPPKAKATYAGTPPQKIASTNLRKHVPRQYPARE